MTVSDQVAKSSETSSHMSASQRFNKWRGPSKTHLAIALALLLVVAGLVLIELTHRKSSTSSIAQIRPSGIPANISTSLANLMGLSPTSNIAAPSFTLTDQNGHTLSLSSFKGQAVVLEFMDPFCTDICPLVSQEFVDAYHDLGTSASHVVFIAVNVNKYHLDTAAVQAFTNEHGLSNIPNWHFFTGPLTTLQSTWSDYGISVDAPSPTADVIHTSMIFFIDANGRERFVAAPTDYHTPQGAAYLPSSQITAWGHGIALTAENLTK